MVQMGRPDGQHAKPHCPFHRRQEQNYPRPLTRDDVQRGPHKTLARRSGGRWHGRRRRPSLPLQVGPHQAAHHTKQHRHKSERPAPAQHVGQQPTGQLATHDTHGAAQARAGQHFLQLAGGNRVSDPGHGQRDQCGSPQRHQHTGEQQHVQAVREHSHQAGHTTKQCGISDDTKLAEAVAQRAVKELRDAVGDGKNGHHLRRLRQPHVKNAGQLGQHGITNALRGHAGKGAKGQQQDGALGCRGNGVGGSAGHEPLLSPSCKTCVLQSAICGSF